MNKILCVILAGGRGSRFGSPLKFLTHVCGKPLIEKLLTDIEIVCRYTVIALSKRTLDAVHVCKNKHYIAECVETSGEDLVHDLALLLEMFPKPLLVVGADIYMTNNKILIDFIDRALKTEENVVTLVVNNDGEKLVGITLFKKSYGSWRNITYPKNSVMDIDDYDDLKRVERECHQF
ncbi:MAG: NTP transferase domain-containing protein [Ignisphaera sp.]|nr:NTP transferase domain-containing protein [Ignisphaera sp.]MCX8168209.1 NTP transferase domain-containing protein [Ignisphaera sp.]MDW8084921.1 NTP transferase domain-containing protein [Ignisphaera sp.]